MTFAAGLEIPTAEEVEYFHTEAIKKFGGDPGVLKAGCTEGNIGSAITSASYYGGDDEVDLIHLAAYLLIKFAKHHCFVDGNKRVAWVVAVDTFRRNFIGIRATNKEAQEIVEGIVQSSEPDVALLAEWFAERLQPLD